MKQITDLRNRVANFNEALTSGRLIQNIIWDNEAYIIDLNAEEQLYEQGINRLGVEIADYAPYSPVTIAIKEAKGQPTNRVTLRDEGDFESSFFLEVGDKQFEIKASDFKTEDLIRKYGRQILGLTDENIAILIWQYIYPDLINEAKTQIYGK
nr:MAG: virion morphogenesis family protein [Bacteriophage sp.]